MLMTGAWLRRIHRRPLFRELRQAHAQHRQRRVRADVGRQIDLRNHRVPQIGFGRLLRSIEQLLAIHDLDDAAAACSVREVHAIALWAERDRPVQVGRHRTR
jgi:hypothetical protein